MGAVRGKAVGAVLEQIALASRTLLPGRTRPFGGTGLSRSQYDALFHLAHASEPVTPGGLARAMRVTPGAVTQLVDGLRELGLVEQLPHASDARSRTLHLSPSARQEVDEFEAAAVALVVDRFEHLELSELELLRDLLSRVDIRP